MSVLVTVRPTSDLGAGTWTLEGFGTKWQGLSDNVDANSGMHALAHQPPYEDSGQVALANPSVPSTARVEYVQTRLRMARLDIGSLVVSILASPYNLFPHEDAVVTTDGNPHNWDGARLPKNPATNVDWGTELQSLRWSAKAGKIGPQYPDQTVAVQELYVDVSYRRQGSVVVNTPTEGSSSVDNRPTISWTPSAPDNPTNPQAEVLVKVFDSATYGAGGFDPWASNAYSWKFQSTDPSIREIEVSQALQGGKTYRAYVWIRQPWSGSAGAWWSPSDFNTFTLIGQNLPAPLVTAFDDPDNYRMNILVNGTMNMLNQDEYGFENGIGSWVAVSNCSLSQHTYGGVGYQTESKALKATPTGAGALSFKTGKKTLETGKTYKVSILGATLAGTAQLAHSSVLLYNSSNVLQRTLNSPSESLVTSGTNPKLDFTFTATGSEVKGELQITVENSTGAANTFVFDLAYFAPHIASTDWGPGSDYYSTTTYKIERSIDNGVTWENVHAESDGYPNGFAISTPIEHQEDLFFDYVAPIGIPVIYRATAFAGNDLLAAAGLGFTSSLPSASSNAETLTIVEWHIMHPDDHDKGMVIDVLPPFSQKIDEQHAIYHPLGRRNAVVVSDVIGGEDGELKIQTIGNASFLGLKELLESQSVLLLRSPYTQEQWFINIVGTRSISLFGYDFDEAVREVSITYIEADAVS